MATTDYYYTMLKGEYIQKLVVVVVFYIQSAENDKLYKMPGSRVFTTEENLAV